MGNNTAIEWSDASWNPLVGCSRVSEGCRHCYAERQAYRAEAMGISRYDGITRKVGGEIRWTGKVALVESALALPLKWKTPRRIFVNSMSDLFHEQVKDEWIAAIFAVMFMAGHHVYQILTKRPERMHRWLTWFQDQPDKAGLLLEALADVSPQALDWPMGRAKTGPWPKPHIWLGVSIEDQATADARIPLLLQTPAAVRWVSYEPALGPVDFARVRIPHGLVEINGGELPGLDWIVVGGESGPGARPFDLAWARQTIAQGREAGVLVFCKQLGARPYTIEEELGDVHMLKFTDRKGGDPAEWPEDLRVREYPKGDLTT